jgi:hypothetical protein
VAVNLLLEADAARKTPRLKRSHQGRLAGMRKLGSPNSMNFIPWKKMLGGYQSSFGFKVARRSLLK